ncbi:hypothetical protein Trydic_g10522 [Trypoxylus dichotomus]
MPEGTDDEIQENTEEKQSMKNEEKNKTVRPQKQEEFKHKVGPIIIKEIAKWTKTCKSKTTPSKCANCQDEHLSTYINAPRTLTTLLSTKNLSTPLRQK